ncbi:uncharacterized protein LOC109540570 [Dendroctonus ponderosae]|uniref:Uncharacterized protein n=1 Tax=Dendroctonus ponderosae TaxID=77166 RepID=U4U413_DENPD|nr:uncharacterized protein LOC109540570 [Dendroctonus ponderosae]ERL88634.1 hypothetical protein D910_06019 [Dendroctonus ponderosae]KAH1015016.1 hypothetical protein HUJ05_012799 [Dendroctonus ponderosae]
MDSSESIAQKLEDSIRRVTKDLLTVSDNTVMHIPEVGKFRKFAWVKDDDVVAAFRRNFDQISGNELPNISEEEQRTVVKDLTARRNFLKGELEKMVEERTSLKNNILNLSENVSNICISNESITFT